MRCALKGDVGSTSLPLSVSSESRASAVTFRAFIHGSLEEFLGEWCGDIRTWLESARCFLALLALSICCVMARSTVVFLTLPLTGSVFALPLSTGVTAEDLRSIFFLPFCSSNWNADRLLSSSSLSEYSSVEF